MYEEFKEYLEGIHIAQKILRENMLEYVLFSDSVLIRKEGFLKLFIAFIGDIVKVEIEIDESENYSKVKSLYEYTKKIGNSECIISHPKSCQFTIRVSNYDEFIKFFDKYILDMNV